MGNIQSSLYVRHRGSGGRREFWIDMAKEEWEVDGYGSMKGLIRLRSGSPRGDDEGEEEEEDDDEDNGGSGGGGSSESDVEE
ncbi:hypothetical protein K1719_020551 [Acacia pycnantha]|nr:hypothetical protein K1719_020551 [Acacia pycnantha]